VVLIAASRGLSEIMRHLHECASIGRGRGWFWGEIATRYVTRRSTRDGTAKGSDPGAAKKGDFEKSSGELVFTDGENFQSITVTVYDDVETEVDEVRSPRPDVTRLRE